MGPVFDDTATFPHTGWLRGAAEHGDWPAVAQFFRTLPGDHDRSSYADVLAKVAGVERMLTAAAAERPDLTLPRVLLARRLTEQAWEARSDLRAKYVSAAQFATMRDYLRQAELLLIDVTAAEPGNVPAWTCRLITARGLSLGVGETRRRYDRLAATDPHHFPAQSLLLQQLCPKWGGTWDEVHAFADACARGGPPGGLHGALVAFGHLERWLELGDRDGPAYLRRPDVQRGLESAAAQSVLHPRFRPQVGMAIAHSAFAMCFALAGVDQRAAIHFRRLGKPRSNWPWSYFPSPEKAFAKLRDRALNGALQR